MQLVGADKDDVSVGRFGKLCRWLRDQLPPFGPKARDRVEVRVSGGAAAAEAGMGAAEDGNMRVFNAPMNNTVFVGRDILLKELQGLVSQKVDQQRIVLHGECGVMGLSRGSGEERGSPLQSLPYSTPWLPWRSATCLMRPSQLSQTASPSPQAPRVWARRSWP